MYKKIFIFFFLLLAFFININPADLPEHDWDKLGIKFGMNSVEVEEKYPDFKFKHLREFWAEFLYTPEVSFLGYRFKVAYEFDHFIFRGPQRAKLIEIEYRFLDKPKSAAEWIKHYKILQRRLKERFGNDCEEKIINDTGEDLSKIDLEKEYTDGRVAFYSTWIKKDKIIEHVSSQDLSTSHQLTFYSPEYYKELMK
jgi:hypothetical protein